MRVLLDAYWWAEGPPSGRNVVRTLVPVWAQRFPDDDLTIKVRYGDVELVRDALTAAGVVAKVLSYPRWARIQALAAMTLRASRRDFDAVITNNFASLRSTAPQGVLVYDALFVAHPEWFKRWERVYLGMIRPCLRRAQRVFTISVTENARIAEAWPEVRDKCVPVGLGVPLGLTAAQSTRPALETVGESPFILSVGRLNVRKNLGRLIAAFDEFGRRNDTHHLLIVGEPDGAVERLELSEDSQRRVHFLGFVSDGELRWLYSHCDLFVFPSLDEGLGLPLLEAALEGARAAASDIPVFRELDLACCYFDPLSTSAITEALHAGLGAPRPGEFATEHTWERTVEMMRASLVTVGKGDLG